MIYVTANTGFSDADHIRAQKIIRSWNAIVTQNDIVINIGTFATDRPLYYMQQLNGMIVSVVGDNDADVPGIKFKQLYLYADYSFSHIKDKDKEVLWVLSSDPAQMDKTGYPLILGVDIWTWRQRSPGQWAVTETDSHLIGQQIINANIDLWDHKPISMQMITQRYLCS